MLPDWIGPEHVKRLGHRLASVRVKHAPVSLQENAGILDAGPKGAPGRDKPVPYGRVAQASTRNSSKGNQRVAA